MELITYQLLVGISVSAAASLIGVFAILKRMSLVGDAMTHVALPGIALAIFFGINPFIGALAFLLLTVVGVWFLESRSSLSIDTLVGVFFTTSLALGALFIPQLDILEALFGDISKVTSSDALISVCLSLLIIVILLTLHKQMALNMVSRDMAASIGINYRKMDLLYFLLFALGVALGIKFVGAILMGALIITPAAAAKNISRSLHGFIALSMIMGILSAVFGVYVSSAYGYAPGPIFILTGTVMFVFSLIARGFLRR